MTPARNAPRAGGLAAGRLAGYARAVVVLCGTAALLAGPGGGLRGFLPGSSAGGAARGGRGAPGDADDDYSSILGGGRRPLPARSSAGGTGGPCDGVLLLLPPSSVRTAEGLLAGYLAAVLAATLADRALVILDEGYGDDTTGTGRAGLAALVDHPDELSGGCAAPCGGTLGHDGWSARSWPNKSPAAAAPCAGYPARGVAAVKGDDAAAYLAAVMRDALSDGAAPGARAAAAFRWATRLGAGDDEARAMSATTGARDTLDYASALLARAGLPRLGARAAEDVASSLGEDGRTAHLRDAVVATDVRIPLADRLSRLSDECRHHDVYVATDSPGRVRDEIAALPRNGTGPDALAMVDWCATFTFDVAEDVAGPSQGPYGDAVEALGRLAVLARSRRVVADPGSDVYALLRFFRRRIREDGGEGEGGPTYVEGLVAAVEGRRGAEIYDAGPRWAARTRGGVGADGGDGNDGDGAPAIQFFVKASGGELYLNRARYIADTWARQAGVRRVTFLFDHQNEDAVDELGRSAPWVEIRHVDGTDRQGEYKRGRGNKAAAWEAQRTKTRAVFLDYVTDDPPDWVCYLDDDMLVNVSNLRRDLAEQSRTCAHCLVADAMGRRPEGDGWTAGGWCMNRPLAKRTAVVLDGRTDESLGWTNNDDVSFNRAVMKGAVGVRPRSSPRWYSEYSRPVRTEGGGVRKVTVHDDVNSRAIGAVYDFCRTRDGWRDDVDDPRAFVESLAVYHMDFAHCVTAGSSLANLCPKWCRHEC